jgi:histidyl-tRNA synthetase
MSGGIKAVKGMRDLLPPETALWDRVDAAAREVFHAYNYGEIRTPLLEETQLFARGVGAETDIVAKEMYTFDDRDGGSLTLRPEATASVVRAHIEHNLGHKPGLAKLYYIGPMFRRERPQKGRYRQFYQIGAEAIGSESPVVDAEMLEMLCALLDRVGLKDYRILLNSLGDPACRPKYLTALREALAGVKDKLCGDCQRRADTNPLRVLDCKVPQDQEIIAGLPVITDFLCAPCTEHYAALRRHLDARGIAYELTPRMVRGLDYYTRTTFEFVHGALGAQNSVLGGGRYDGLSETLGGGKAPGIGFSIGEDRLVYLLAESGAAPAAPALEAYVVWLGEAACAHAVALARRLRAAGHRIEVQPEPYKMRRALELAAKQGARFALIVGDNEIAAGRYPLKDLARGEQKEMTEQEILAALAASRS